MKSVQNHFLNPAFLIKQLTIKKNDHIAFLGSGSGYFSLELSKLIGDEGALYAIDILKNKIESVESLTRVNNLFNTFTFQTNIEDYDNLKKIFKKRKPNLVFLINVLSENLKKGLILKNALKILKKGGKLVITEWKNKKLGIIPPKEMLVDPKKLLLYLKNQKIKLLKELKTGDYHWGYVFKK